MASYLRPRRGKKSTAEAQLTASAPLKRGEVFFEVPTGGVGTGLGNIKMGDGSTAYASLPYFLSSNTGAAKVAFTNTTAPDSNPYSTNATYVGNVIPTNTLATIFTNIKKLLLNHNSQLTTLNNDLGFKTRINNGKPEWSLRGADSWSPFKPNNKTQTISASYSVPSQSTRLHTITFNELSEVTGVMYINNPQMGNASIYTVSISKNTVAINLYGVGGATSVPISVTAIGY